MRKVKLSCVLSVLPNIIRVEIFLNAAYGELLDLKTSNRHRNKVIQKVLG